MDTGEDALDTVSHMMRGTVSSSISDRWGTLRAYGCGIQFTPGGETRVASILGWILGMAHGGNIEFARILAKDFLRHLDHFRDSTSREDTLVDPRSLENLTSIKLPYLSDNLVPSIFYELGDDGDLHDFWFIRWALCRNQDSAREHDNRHRQFSVGYYRTPLLYRCDYNGGLLYHGPGAGEKFSVTLNPVLWQIHT